MKIRIIGLILCSALASCSLPCGDSMSLLTRLQCENIAFPPTTTHAKFTEPRTKSNYRICKDETVTSLTDEERFDCAEETFWHGLSDGRQQERSDAEKMMSTVINLNADTDNIDRLAKLYRLRGDLRMAMSMENGKSLYFIFTERFTSNDYKKAFELNGNNESLQAFSNAIDMVIAIIFNNWGNAISLAETSLDSMDESHTTNPHQLIQSGIYQGFPLSTGIPQKAIAAIEKADCRESLPWCILNSSIAPHAQPGIAYHLAELYARMGNKAEAVEHLNNAANADGFESWAFRYYVDNALSDTDTFFNKWRGYGDYKAPMFVGYANHNIGCSFCHTRQ